MWATIPIFRMCTGSLISSVTFSIDFLPRAIKTPQKSEYCSLSGGLRNTLAFFLLVHRVSLHVALRGSDQLVCQAYGYRLLALVGCLGDCLGEEVEGRVDPPDGCGVHRLRDIDTAIL